VAGRRQHCQTENQPRYGLEIANREQINWHSRPPWIDRRCGRPPRRLTVFESIHDCIDVNANASRVSTSLEPKFCIASTAQSPTLMWSHWPSRSPSGYPTSRWTCRQSPAPCVRSHIERKNDTSSQADGSPTRH
jgi:hypothetical protein